jgi:hypothetical protein
MCLCFVNTAGSCQLYSSTKLILICFKNIFFFWKKKCVHPDLEHTWMCLCKFSTRLMVIWNLKFWLWRIEVAIEQSLKGTYPQIQVKFRMPFLILTVLYYGISNGHKKYELQILSYTWDITLRNPPNVNNARALFTLTYFKNR